MGVYMAANAKTIQKPATPTTSSEAPVPRTFKERSTASLRHVDAAINGLSGLLSSTTCKPTPAQAEALQRAMKERIAQLTALTEGRVVARKDEIPDN
jgi:hypothetical protein